MRLDEIQPSQLYISSDKLRSVMNDFPSEESSVERISIKKIKDDIVYVDGHTRAFAAFQCGFSKVPVYWEYEELDWEAYEIYVEWCKEEGIFTIADLRNRIIPHHKYEILWYERCAKMQNKLKDNRKLTQKKV